METNHDRGTSPRPNLFRRGGCRSNNHNAEKLSWASYLEDGFFRLETKRHRRPMQRSELFQGEITGIRVTNLNISLSLNLAEDGI